MAPLTASAAPAAFRRVAATPLLDVAAVRWVDREPNRRRTLMFPTVVDMRATPSPLDAFYLYYAPHRSAGIGLATSPCPEGPWTPFPHNPILTLDSFPGINDHLSSPELVHRRDSPGAPFWLYVHGRTGPRAEGFGQHTCAATSPDAIHWQPLSPHPVLIATAAQSGHANSAAYARLFQRDGWHYALYKAETVHALARSRDGLTWEHWPHNPVLAPDPAAGDRNLIRHTGLLVRGRTLFIFYSAAPDRDGPHGTEEIKLATFSLAGDDWLRWGPLRRLGTVLAPSLEWERANVRDPFPLVVGETLYLYYVGGHEHGIGLATTPLKGFPE